ncbi:MAG: hypothetical protein JMDDDDMK_02981 [Acidobacteria bacterium]|nr:hypothetical protein [Acidobacteriota bacterium]
MFDADFAERQAADDGHHRLRARVAAGADQQRDEEIKRDHSRQFGFKTVQHLARQSPRDEQKQQPTDAFLNYAEDRIVEIRAVERAGFDRRHSQDVFGLLLDHYVNHIVNGDEADDASVFFEHRHSQQVVLGDFMGDRFLIVAGVNGHGFAPHHLDHGLIQFGHHQIAQADRSQQSSRFGIEHVAGVNGFLFARDRADVFESFGDGELRVELDELGGHDAASGVLRILQQMFEFGFSFGVDPGQYAAAFSQSHLLNDVGAFVG